MPHVTATRPPPARSLGPEAIAWIQSTGQRLTPWQQEMLTNWLTVDANGEYVHNTFPHGRAAITGQAD